MIWPYRRVCDWCWSVCRPLAASGRSAAVCLLRCTSAWPKFVRGPSRPNCCGRRQYSEELEKQQRNNFAHVFFVDSSSPRRHRHNRMQIGLLFVGFLNSSTDTLCSNSHVYKRLPPLLSLFLFCDGNQLGLLINWKKARSVQFLCVKDEWMDAVRYRASSCRALGLCQRLDGQDFSHSGRIAAGRSGASTSSSQSKRAAIELDNWRRKQTVTDFVRKKTSSTGQIFDRLVRKRKKKKQPEIAPLHCLFDSRICKSPSLFLDILFHVYLFWSVSVIKRSISRV